jgi:DNA-binding transcriptional MerR regulator
MEYTISQLAKMAGVTTRTLRYYDQCGLLRPKTVASNGYRMYGQAEIDRLQQIMFFRELGVELSEIERVLADENFNELTALQNHLITLKEKRDRLDVLINNVQKSISVMKGAASMSNEEKFEGFKEKLISENEQKYGEEIRKKYGNDIIDNTNTKLKNMSKEQYSKLETLTEEFHNTLKQACAQGDPGSKLAQRACELHKQWLCFYWQNYSKEAHIGVTQLYVDDPRFTTYYDNLMPGCASFLRDAVRIFCS